MIPECQGEAYQNIFTAQEIEYFKKACELVSKVPYKLDGEVVRCHELVRAVAKALELTFEDGYYGMVEHSWIWLSPREPLTPPPRILDVYVPGRVPQVQLVDPCTFLPWDYRRGPPRDDICKTTVEDLYRRLVPSDQLPELPEPGSGGYE
jgi:hypothetical protein